MMIRCFPLLPPLLLLLVLMQIIMMLPPPAPLLLPPLPPQLLLSSVHLLLLSVLLKRYQGMLYIYRILTKRMAVVLLSVFDEYVVHHIHDFIPRRPNVDWEELGGFTMIYTAMHLVTYTGDGDGGYVYFSKERLLGWYRCHRSWGRGPTFAYTDFGIVAVKWIGDVGYIGVILYNYEEHDWLEDEYDVREIITDDFTGSVVEPNAVYGP